jgi:hypothetical protein
MRAHSVETASLAHFTLPGVNLDERVPPNSEGLGTRTKEEVAAFYAERFPWLVEKLKKDGDAKLADPKKRVRSPEMAAAQFMKEAYEELVPLLEKPGDILDNMLAMCGVERSRLPQKPTIEDIGYEAHFIGTLKIHERRLKLPPGTLHQFVTQDNVPSWVAWREVDRAVKRLAKAEGSSLNDKMMLPFALYVDALEVDKRIMDCVRQSASRSALVQQIRPRIFRRKSLADLITKLESLAA